MKKIEKMDKDGVPIVLSQIKDMVILFFLKFRFF
jgi:hypothetical protein